MNKALRKALPLIRLAKSTEDLLNALHIAGYKEPIVLNSIGFNFEHTDLDYSGFTFKNTDFGSARLINCVAKSVLFENCNFSKSWLAAEGTGISDFSRSKFINCTFDQVTFGAARMNLSETYFKDCKFSDCNFRIGQLENATFDHCIHNRTTFRSANLFQASFTNSKLQKVSFEKARVEGVDFTNTKFINADFWGPIDFINCKGLERNPTIIEEG